MYCIDTNYIMCHGIEKIKNRKKRKKDKQAAMRCVPNGIMNDSDYSWVGSIRQVPRASKKPIRGNTHRYSQLGNTYELY